MVGLIGLFSDSLLVYEQKIFLIAGLYPNFKLIDISITKNTSFNHEPELSEWFNGLPNVFIAGSSLQKPDNYSAIFEYSHPSGKAILRT